MIQERFLRLLRKTSIPADRKSVKYNLAVRQRHAAILGVCALIDSYPYTVEKFMPELLTNVLAEHTYDPVRLWNDLRSRFSRSSNPTRQIPISTTVRKCASNFKKTHQDTWHEDSKRFTEEQLSALSTLLTGSSYCKHATHPWVFGISSLLIADTRRLRMEARGSLTFPTVLFVSVVIMLYAAITV